MKFVCMNATALVNDYRLLQESYNSSLVIDNHDIEV